MFLKANKDNGIIAEVIGGRKRENGLVVPCLYKCRSKNKKIAEILIKEVSSQKYQHMDIILKKKTNFSCRVGGAYSRWGGGGAYS